MIKIKTTRPVTARISDIGADGREYNIRIIPAEPDPDAALASGRYLEQKFDLHADVTCFHCAAPIGKQGKPLFYGFPRGAYGMWCGACKWRTYYDTPDTSVKFDAKGDPVAPTCSCGCMVPYAEWPTQDYSGYQSCPECGMV